MTIHTEKPFEAKDLLKGFGINPRAVWSSDIKHQNKIFYLYLLSFMGNERNTAWPGMKRIAKETGLGRTSIAKAIQYWHDIGMLERRIDGQKNIYVLPCFETEDKNAKKGTSVPVLYKTSLVQDRSRTGTQPILSENGGIETDPAEDQNRSRTGTKHDHVQTIKIHDHVTSEPTAELALSDALKADVKTILDSLYQNMTNKGMWYVDKGQQTGFWVNGRTHAAAFLKAHPIENVMKMLEWAYNDYLSWKKYGTKAITAKNLPEVLSTFAESRTPKKVDTSIEDTRKRIERLSKEIEIERGAK